MPCGYVGEALFHDGPAEGIIWETDCARVPTSLFDFATWVLAHRTGTGATRWGYFSYQRVADVFAAAPQDIIAMLPWSTLPQVSPAAARDAVFWFGTGGSATQGHYDTYGTNSVVQLSGTKRWLLFPPGTALAPSRVPYEESSVFSGLTTAEAVAAAARCGVSAVEAVLAPGDVLFVPRHWWHFVASLEDSVAVNVWQPHPADVTERLSEAVVTPFFFHLFFNYL